MIDLRAAENCQKTVLIKLELNADTVLWPVVYSLEYLLTWRYGYERRKKLVGQIAFYKCPQAERDNLGCPIGYVPRTPDRYEYNHQGFGFAYSLILNQLLLQLWASFV